MIYVEREIFWRNGIYNRIECKRLLIWEVFETEEGIVNFDIHSKHAGNKMIGNTYFNIFQITLGTPIFIDLSSHFQMFPLETDIPASTLL